MVGAAEVLLLVSPSVAVVVPVLVPHRLVAVHGEVLVAGAAHVEGSGHDPVGQSVAISVQAHAWVRWVQVHLVVDAVVVVVRVYVGQVLRDRQGHVVDPDRVRVAADAAVLVVHPLEGVPSCAHRGGVGPGGHSGPALRQASVHVEPQVVPEALCGGLVVERDVACEGVHRDFDRARLRVVDVTGLRHVRPVDRVGGWVPAGSHSAHEPVRVAVGGPSGWDRAALEVAEEWRGAREVWYAIAVVVSPCGPV